MRKIRSKRIFLYVAVLALLMFGRRGTDIGQLRPVEVVQLYEKNGLLFLETDTGDAGWGMTLEQAANKLRETTPGKIYLDTADFLLLEEGLEQYMPAVKSYLKRNTRMAYGPEKVDLEAAAGYLRVHRPSGKVGKQEKPREMLAFEGGKIILKNIKEMKISVDK